MITAFPAGHFGTIGCRSSQTRALVLSRRPVPTILNGHQALLEIQTTAQATLLGSVDSHSRDAGLATLDRWEVSYKVIR